MSLAKQVHIVSTDFDDATETPEYDRIRHIFDNYGHSASKIYVLTNDNLQETDEDLEREALQGVRQTLKEVTSAADNDGIESVEVDYYDFGSALTTIFECIYKEQQNDNNVFVNLSGGTKPLAIAMSFACALAGLDESAFYIRKEYSKEDGKIQSDVISSMDILRLDLFDLHTTIPTDEKKQNLLRFLLETENDPIGVTDLLVEAGEIAATPSDGDDNRYSTMQQYNQRANQLNDDTNYVDKGDDGYTLTSTGQLMAEIVKIKRGIDRDE